MSSGVDFASAIAIAHQRFQEGRVAEALAVLDGTGPAGEGDAVVQSNRCLLLQRLGRGGEAVRAGERAAALQPRMPSALSNLAGAYRQVGRMAEAFSALDRALVADALFADAHAQRGLLLQEVGQLKDAVDAQRHVMSLSGDLPEAWTNIGVALKGFADSGLSLEAFRQALVAAPDFGPAWSNLLMCAQYEASLTASQLRSLAASWQQATSTAKAVPRPAAKSRAGRKLRVGYVSADFYEHPVGRFLKKVLEAHDHAAVDVHCYSSQARRDLLTEALMGSVPHWSFVGELTDAQVAYKIREDGIDILVDLSGHTAGNRLGVFALRPAPLQVSWLGYFASTGLPEMDAVLLSRDQLAEGGEGYFTERVYPLACCQFIYEPPADAPDIPALPTRPPVFGSFNNLAKLTDDVVLTWSSVLAAVPGSRLLLKREGLADPWLRERLARRFAAHGVDPARLELRGPSPHRAMLEEYGDIDVALDPFPFSGALTTCEALWMGVPVVTLPWHRPVSRQSASILKAIGLPDCIARTPLEYVDIAKSLATDRNRLKILRASLRNRLHESAAGDGGALARSLEDAYRQLFDEVSSR